jgi:sigma-B regulation protein RsbU (phosphoserine phosphatase)
MSPDRTPPSQRYQEALVPLARRIEEPALRKRLSEVLTLLDFNSTLNLSLELQDILDLVLYAVMGETRASWAGVLLRDGSGVLRPAARRGRSDAEWAERGFDLDEGWEDVVRERTAAGLLAPLSKGDGLVGALLLGPRVEPYGEEERLFAEVLAVSAAAAIDNGRVYEEMRELNRRLSLKVYQLNSLFDISRELNRSPDEARVRDVLLTSGMGHVLTTRALVLQGGSLVEERGRTLSLEERRALEGWSHTLQSLPEDREVRNLDAPTLRRDLEALGVDLVLPLRSGETAHGVLLLGPRASGEPLAEEDRDFLRSLASQVAATLDNLRLTEQWVEKQKIEKEMALARDIQRGLLPEDDPDIEGWDVAGINIPCLTVGGDYFDYLDRSGGEHWIVIADVSGKGTGAALLMASIQAALHALAGLGAISLEALTERLNEVVYTSTEVNRYVTAFFASLDTETGRLTYVNAGHCYPLLVRAGGGVERLVDGGPVIGILPEVEVSLGETRVDKGDRLVLYTDGLSETRNAEGDEFEETGILELLERTGTAPSREVVARLVAGVRVFAAEAGLTDDLTLVVVQRS